MDGALSRRSPTPSSTRVGASVRPRPRSSPPRSRPSSAAHPELLMAHMREQRCNDVQFYEHAMGSRSGAHASAGDRDRELRRVQPLRRPELRARFRVRRDRDVVGRAHDGQGAAVRDRARTARRHRSLRSAPDRQHRGERRRRGVPSVGRPTCSPATTSSRSRTMAQRGAVKAGGGRATSRSSTPARSRRQPRAARRGTAPGRPRRDPRTRRGSRALPRCTTCGDQPS